MHLILQKAHENSDSGLKIKFTHSFSGTQWAATFKGCGYHLLTDVVETCQGLLLAPVIEVVWHLASRAQGGLCQSLIQQRIVLADILEPQTNSFRQSRNVCMQF